MNKNNIVDLGAGENPVTKDAVTVDLRPHNNPDIVHDLEKTPWPLKDNSFDKVYMSHCLEHLYNWEDALHEIDRILKTGGTAVIRVPHYSSSIRRPDHRAHFSINGIRELFVEGGSMYLGLDMEIESITLSYSQNRDSVKGKLAYLFDPVLNSRFGVYIGQYLPFFIGGIHEIKIELVK